MAAGTHWPGTAYRVWACIKRHKNKVQFSPANNMLAQQKMQQLAACRGAPAMAAPVRTAQHQQRSLVVRADPPSNPRVSSTGRDYKVRGQHLI